MTFEEHCRESEKLFGDRFELVHLWLDEFMGKPPHGMRHRRIRHHKAGIAQAERLFGPMAAKAARRHIESDLELEGWTQADPFPADEADFVKIGFF
jgi:hypothetical protein